MDEANTTREPDQRVTDTLGEGRYELLERLGEGGQATVYRARDTHLGREVAIKLLPVGRGQEQRARTRFEREARRAASLHHPNIVAIHELAYDAARQSYFMVSEYVAGIDLRRYLQDHPGPVPFDQALSVLRPIAEALDYAHVQGVLHRDVKPGNILLDGKTGRAVLCDFGLARMAEGEDLDATSENASVPGTPAYMSPEQCLGSAVDQRCDIYSFALMAYEMLCGRHPFRGQNDTSESILYKQVHEAPPPARKLNPSLSGGVEGVLAKALAKNAYERYGTAGEFMQALEAAQHAGGMALSPRLRRYALGAGAVLVLIIVGVALWRGLAEGREKTVSATATLGPAATQTQPSALPTSPLSATQGPLTALGDAPQIVSPGPNEAQTGRFVALSWTWNGDLANDQVYQVEITLPGGEQRAYKIAQRTLTLDLEQPGDYRWSVAVGKIDTGFFVPSSQAATAHFQRVEAVESASVTPAPSLTWTPGPTATTAPATSTVAPSRAPTQVARVYTVQVDGLDAWGLQCSTLIFFNGAEVIERVSMADHLDGRVQISLGQANWLKFEGGPGGQCPWTKFTLVGANADHIDLVGDSIQLGFQAASTGGGGGGGGGKSPTEPAWSW